MINIKFTVTTDTDLEILKAKLNSKTIGFSEFDKTYSGYYYLIDLIEKSSSLNFNNYQEFYDNLSYIVQVFPLVNNGAVRYNDYFLYFEEFKDYIRDNFGFLPQNRIFWRRFWVWLIFLFCCFGILITPLIGGILGLIFAIILANYSENKRRKKGLVLGVRKK